MGKSALGSNCPANVRDVFASGGINNLCNRWVTTNALGGVCSNDEAVPEIWLDVPLEARGGWRSGYFDIFSTL